MEKLIIDNEYFKVIYYENHNILAYKFLKFVPSAIYRESMIIMRDFFIKNHLRKLMPILSEAQVVGSEDQAWFVSEVIQKMAAASLKYAAIVPAKSVFGSVAAKNIIETLEKSNDGVLRKVFEYENEAIQWLNSHA